MIKKKYCSVSSKLRNSGRKFNLRKEYEKSWNYIKDSKKFLFLVIGIFLAFVLIGFFVPVPEYFSQKILEFIQEILLKTQGMSNSQLIGFIFFNNIQSSFISMIFGIVFGIFPIISTIVNGYLLGFVSNISVQNAGVFSLWRILPHGIFELPAMFVSFALGIRLGFSIFNEKKFDSFRENFISCLKVFVLIIIPLLILAAIIEGTLIFLGV